MERAMALAMRMGMVIAMGMGMVIAMGMGMGMGMVIGAVATSDSVTQVDKIRSPFSLLERLRKEKRHDIIRKRNQTTLPVTLSGATHGSWV